MRRRYNERNSSNRTAEALGFALVTELLDILRAKGVLTPVEETDLYNRLARDFGHRPDNTTQAATEILRVWIKGISSATI